MGYQPLSAFMRPLRHADLSPEVSPSSSEAVEKWQLHRELVAGRKLLSLRSGELNVLQVLFSFYPGDRLAIAEKLVVFASNRSICSRANGMPESTLRRHLSNLVAKGFLRRRDSPNGKRFARTNALETEAFGLDLRPLLERRAHICEAAQAAVAEDKQIKDGRTAVALLCRDLLALIACGTQIAPDDSLWIEARDLADEAKHRYRRKLDSSELRELKTALSAAVDCCHRRVLELTTERLSASGDQNERHIQDSDLEYLDSKAASEPPPIAARQTTPLLRGKSAIPSPQLSLWAVMAMCKTVEDLAGRTFQTWEDFVHGLDQLARPTGIDAGVWAYARQSMGPRDAAIALAVIIERFGEIRSPNAYLRCLAQKAADRSFSASHMLSHLGTLTAVKFNRA